MIQSSGVFTHLDIPKMCSHTREVEFDSQHAPSTSGRRSGLLAFHPTGIWVGFGIRLGFDYGWPAQSYVCSASFDFVSGNDSLLPLKINLLMIERPRLVVNCRNLSAPRAFMKMFVV